MNRRIVQLMTLAIMPFFFLLLGIHLLIWTAQVWVPLEYRLPGFPADRYGFSYEQRVRWSEVDISYLVSGDTIAFFDDYYLESGEPMHNPRELRHMEDVKQLIDASRIALGVLAVAVLGGHLYMGLRHGRSEAGMSMMAGGRLTLLLMIVLGGGIAVSFNSLFVGFHHIFFTGDTWLFSYSDTFIRLYPERFWLDAFVYIVLLTLIQALLSWLIGKRLSRQATSQG